MFSLTLVCLFVCEHDYAETTQLTVTKFSGKVSHRAWKKPLDSGSNPVTVHDG